MSKILAIHGGKPVRKRPFPAWPIITDSLIEDISRTTASGAWSIAKGTETSAFEQIFAKIHGVRYCTACTNGTHSLLIALLACGIQAGQEVIVPSWTFFSTAQVVVAANCIPVFADIDPETLTLDMKHVASLINKNTFGIIPVHFAGHPADMTTLMQLCKIHNLICIEDCAQAHGATYHGKSVGSFGQAGSFSFQMSKNITAGEGGALITNDSTVNEQIFSHYNLGRSFSNYVQYIHESIGSNYRMTEFQSVLLMHAVISLYEYTNRRNENAYYLDNLLSSIEGITTFKAEDSIRHGRHIYPFRFLKEHFPNGDKKKFVEALLAEGIPITVGYIMGVHQQPVFQNLEFGPYTGYKITNEALSYADVTLPQTDKAVREVCFLPQNTLLGDHTDMENIAEAINKVAIYFRN